MKTIIISKSDFNINDQNSINEFNEKLKEISEPFEVKFDFPITKIPARLFYDTSLVNVTIPDSVIKIDSYAFCGCEKLSEIFLPIFLKTIGPYAFSYCESLKEIVLPNSIKKIDDNTFYNCRSLKEISLPASLTEIDSSAFGHCDSLTQITLPPSINFLKSYAFVNCTSLNQITIQMSKDYFLSNVKGAQYFYNEHKNLLSFEDKSLDTLLSKNDSIESIINNIDPER